MSMSMLFHLTPVIHMLIWHNRGEAGQKQTVSVVFHNSLINTQICERKIISAAFHCAGKTGLTAVTQAGCHLVDDADLGEAKLPTQHNSVRVVNTQKHSDVNKHLLYIIQLPLLTAAINIPKGKDEFVFRTDVTTTCHMVLDPYRFPD